ncbi:hypothetical protein P5673_030647 [Acropora cervicornis]|uniref:Uncharacterized protein n=1 Tax=Acropora cervicornis TaxID=6130 RepID=A0AAD9UT71_ACRCE|nr:hypothetical protein P5673_030647 [Acropora cervicornis]
MVNGEQVAKKCTNTYYSRRKKMVCNTSMASRIRYYCTRSIIEELEKFLLRKNFALNCELWRNREMGALHANAYDGNLWGEFQTVNGMPFLQKPQNYGFMLNFDFFQPMKHRKDYCVRVAERFKWENIIVVGIVPSLDSEPKDQFLEPAVDELKALFASTFWAAIKSISSDVPDTRKICGFKGHSVILGCSRCLKKFPSGFGEKRDYSGFDRNSWSPRMNEDHWRQATKISRSKTNEEQNFI